MFGFYSIFTSTLGRMEYYAAGRIPVGDTETGPGDPGDGREDEGSGGTASGLPASHCGSQGIAMC